MYIGYEESFVSACQYRYPGSSSFDSPFKRPSAEDEARCGSCGAYQI